jgi:hypothetical protein
MRCAICPPSILTPCLHGPATDTRTSHSAPGSRPGNGLRCTDLTGLAQEIDSRFDSAADIGISSGQTRSWSVDDAYPFVDSYKRGEMETSRLNRFQNPLSLWAKGSLRHLHPASADGLW